MRTYRLADLGTAVWCAVATTYASLLGGRIVIGFAAAACETLGVAIVSYTAVEERGWVDWILASTRHRTSTFSMSVGLWSASTREFSPEFRGFEGSPH